MRSHPALRVVPLLVTIGLLVALTPPPALATQWPNEACPDSLTIQNIQDETSPCHPALGDSLFTGIRGIVTARDTKAPGVGFWLQLSCGGPWTGMRVFTANTIWPMAVGDSVIVCPSMASMYQGETELVSLQGTYGSNLDCDVIASGQPLPPFQEGTPATWNGSPTNTAMEPWEDCRVRCLPTPGQGPLRVARILSDGFVVVDNACTSGVCDSVFVDAVTIPNPSVAAPPLGTFLLYVQGIAGQRAAGSVIRMQAAYDLLVGVAGETPRGIALSVAPNPGRSQEIRFSLAVGGHAEVGIYDAAGRQVAVLVRGELPAGTYAQTWNGLDAGGRPVRPGVYFCRLSIGGAARVARLVRTE